MTTEFEVEQWKPVLGYEGRYEVSDLGRVRSLPNARRKTVMIMRPTITGERGGYFSVRLTTSVDGSYKQRLLRVHRLVLEAFVGPPPEGKPWGLHRDGNPHNNALKNLYWGTPLENMEDRRKHGKGNIGSSNPSAILSEDLVKDLKRRLQNRKKGDIAKLSRETGIKYTTLRAIACGENWSHL